MVITCIWQAYLMGSNILSGHVNVICLSRSVQACYEDRNKLFVRFQELLSCTVAKHYCTELCCNALLVKLSFINVELFANFRV